MCGRFTLTVDPEELQKQFGLAQPPPAGLAPRYNIAPSQAVAVVANEPERKLEFFQWGLIPSWAKDPKIGNKLINARAETLAEKPAFRAALKRRRCLVVADGFYEWKKLDGRKQPMYIHLKDGRPFAFAGLWEVWRSPQDELFKTCTIITTEPNALLEGIHNRMPAILPPESYDLWLAPGDQAADAVLPLLRPYNPADMRAVAVSSRVNSPTTDSPELVLPLAV
ncbi:MAG: SOS response-associated peptidase [Anaerolineales bacterium]|nr:SOS response-associated peptidase [Anaerolineales bacterium]